MAVIGTLVAKLNMDSRDFSRGTKKAQGGMSKLSSTAGKLGIAVSAAGAAMAAAAAYGMARLVKQSYATIDALAKTADKLGTTTEALAGLRSAAGLTGVDAGKLDNGLQTLVRRVSEATQGTGEAKKALDELGLSAVEMNSLSPDEQFTRIAESMEGVKNQGDRVRLTYQLFGRSGVDLVNTLNMGSEALKENQKRLERVGYAVNRVDSAKIEAANDSFQRLKESVIGTANKIAVALAPTFQKFFEALTKGWDEMVFIVENFALMSEVAILRFFESILTEAPALEGVFENLAIAGAGLWDGASAGFSKFGEYVMGGLRELANVAIAFASGVSSAWDAVISGNISEALTAFKDGFVETLANQKDVAPKVKFSDIVTNPVNDASEAFRQAAAETAMGFDQQGGLKNIIADRLEELNRLEVAARETRFKVSDAVESALPPEGTGEKASGSSDTSAKKRGSAEAISAILGARRDHEKMIAENTKNLSDIATQQLIALNELVDMGEEGPPVFNLSGVA